MSHTDLVIHHVASDYKSSTGLNKVNQQEPPRLTEVELNEFISALSVVKAVELDDIFPIPPKHSQDQSSSSVSGQLAGVAKFQIYKSTSTAWQFVYLSACVNRVSRTTQPAYVVLKLANVTTLFQLPPPGPISITKNPVKLFFLILKTHHKVAFGG